MTGEERKATLAALDAALDALDALNDRVTLLVTQLGDEHLPPFVYQRVQIAGGNIERTLRAAQGALRAAQAPYDPAGVAPC